VREVDAPRLRLERWRLDPYAVRHTVVVRLREPDPPPGHSTAPFPRSGSARRQDVAGPSRRHLAKRIPVHVDHVLDVAAKAQAVYAPRHPFPHVVRLTAVAERKVRYGC